MVKVHKIVRDGGSSSATRGNYPTVSGYSTFKGYRRDPLIRIKVLKMLTSRRAGPVSTGEIGDENRPENEDKEDGGGAVTPVTPGSYENGEGSKEFLSTGRTGRRNALPDILGRHAETGVADLPDRFEKLNTDTDQSSNSGIDLDKPSTSKQHG